MHVQLIKRQNGLECFVNLDVEVNREHTGTSPALGTSRGTLAVTLGVVGSQLGLPGSIPRLSSLVSRLSLSRSFSLALSWY